jgi:hypothetical protein
MHGRSLSAIVYGAALTSLGLGLGFGSTTAQASPLSSLIANDGSVQVGNLLFDQFSYSPTGQMPSASNVNVTPIVDASGNVGLRFSGGFTDAPGGTGATQQASDALLSYQVSILGGALDGIHLLGNPQVVGAGDGVMSVTETFVAGAQPVQLSIYDSVNGGVASLKLQDAATFGPLPSIQVVTKDILALNLGGYPTESYVDQTFATTVPEPGSVLVLGLGFLAGAAFLGSRQFRARGVARIEGLLGIVKGRP